MELIIILLFLFNLIIFGMLLDMKEKYNEQQNKIKDINNFINKNRDLYCSDCKLKNKKPKKPEPRCANYDR